MNTLSVVVACSLNRAIGKDNTLPWHLPKDLQLFKQNTKGKPVLMGRHTAISIGRALPGRRNLVWTSGAEAPFPGQEVVRSLEEAIALTQGEELCVIGGQRVYEAALPLADKLYLTLVDDWVEDADAFIPAVQPGQWHLQKFQRYPSENDQPSFTYMEYERHGIPATAASQTEVELAETPVRHRDSEAADASA